MGFAHVQQLTVHAAIVFSSLLETMTWFAQFTQPVHLSTLRCLLSLAVGCIMLLCNREVGSLMPSRCRARQVDKVSAHDVAWLGGGLQSTTEAKYASELTEMVGKAPT